MNKIEKEIGKAFGRPCCGKNNVHYIDLSTMQTVVAGKVRKAAGIIKYLLYQPSPGLAFCRRRGSTASVGQGFPDVVLVVVVATLVVVAGTVVVTLVD